MDKETISSELQFKAVRSSGAGGQNVNKVATKVELYFNLESSFCLSDTEKEKLRTFLGNRLSRDGILMLSNGETRSQLRNKKAVIQRFFNLLEVGLEEDKERIATKIPKVVKAKRLKTKRAQSEKKLMRKPPEVD